MHESKIDEKLTVLTEQIQVGVTDRAHVRALLGEPAVSSDRWRFDVFRLRDANRHLVILILPVALTSDEATGYLLVRYDGQGRVEELGRSASHDWEMMEGTPLASAGAEIHNGDLWFVASADGDESFVAVGPSARDAWLRDAMVADRCLVVVGCLDWTCNIEIRIDDGPTAKLPSYRQLIPASVLPGSHRVRVSSVRAPASFDGSQSFECRAGAATYLGVQLELQSVSRGMWNMRANYAVRVTTSQQMPAAFAEQHTLVYLNGEWLPVGVPH